MKILRSIRNVTFELLLDGGTMVGGHRQKDHSVHSTASKALASRCVLQHVVQKRQLRTRSAFYTQQSLLQIAAEYMQRRDNYNNHLQRRNRLSVTDFSFNFNAFSDLECLNHFRFRKQHLVRLVAVMGWPASRTSTKRNRYYCNPLIATCVILRRLATPARWVDLEELFGKHASQLSEIFWEGLECMLNAREHLLTGTICSNFIGSRLADYATAINRISNTLPNCVGFIDGTVLGIAQPKGNLAQRVVYNGHKRKHALKHQAVNTQDGMIMHLHGPIEGRRHDWTLYIRSGLDELLPQVLVYEGRTYCLYGDSGYNARWFMEVPFQGASLTTAQKAFNTAMAAVRISVEWVFKELKMHFATVDFKRKMKIFESPIGMLYTGAMLLSNFQNCFYPNQISQYFCVPPPSLEEYAFHK